MHFCRNIPVRLICTHAHRIPLHRLKGPRLSNLNIPHKASQIRHSSIKDKYLTYKKEKSPSISRLSMSFIYNYYLLVSYPLFLHIYLNMLAYKGRARLNYIATGFFILSLFLINYLFIQGSRVFNSYSLIVTNISYTILSSLVLLRLLKTDDWDIPLQKHPYFWIGGSLIIYSLTMVVILGLQPFILSNKIQIDGKSIYMILSPTVNVILYTCFSYSFFLCQKLTKK